MDHLRAVVGDGPSEATLRALLDRTGGDVAAAANAFFDGSLAEQMAAEPARATGSAPQAGDDVLATLFKTLEDVGKKLAGSAWARHPAACAASAMGRGASL